MVMEKNSILGAIQEIGMQLIADPEGVGKWSAQVEHIGGSNSFFHNAESRISNRIRIPVASRHYLIENFKQEYVYKTFEIDRLEETTVVNAVLVDFMCRNIGISIIPKQPKKIEISFENKDFFGELKKQIGSCFHEDLTWPQLMHAMKRGVYSFGFAVIFVDDLPKFRQKVESEASSCSLHNSGILSLQLPFVIEDLKFPHFRLGVPSFHLFVLEYKGVSDWLDTGLISNNHRSSFADIRKHVDYLLFSNRLSVIRSQIIMMRARCTALLESLPEQKLNSLSAREERMQKLTSISEDLAFYRSTHILAKDFLVYQNAVEEIPEDITPELTKETLEEKLDILGERLLLLEQTLQTRLMIENMTISRNREEQQERTEKSFNILSLMFGTFFIFEVIASFFSWYYSPSDPFAWVAWILMIFSPFVLIYWAIREFQKMTSLKVEPDSEVGAPTKRVHLFCPHCKKGYIYKVTSGEVTCQNCAKPFKLIIHMIRRQLAKHN